MTDTRVVGASVQGESDTYPVWTLRFTWRVTDAKDNPQQTYVFTTSETDAVDRAVFEYDHRADTATLALISAHVKRPDSGWTIVPRGNPVVRHAFQLSPRRPG